MKIERLEDLLQELLLSERLEVKEYINQLEADKLEMAKAIVDDYLENGGTTMSYCRHCNQSQIDGIVSHNDDCIVNKAQKYIEEVERNERD